VGVPRGASTTAGFALSALSSRRRAYPNNIICSGKHVPIETNTLSLGLRSLLPVFRFSSSPIHSKSTDVRPAQSGRVFGQERTSLSLFLVLVKVTTTGAAIEGEEFLVVKQLPIRFTFLQKYLCV